MSDHRRDIKEHPFVSRTAQWGEGMIEQHERELREMVGRLTIGDWNDLSGLASEYPVVYYAAKIARLVRDAFEVEAVEPETEEQAKVRVRRLYRTAPVKRPSER